uniref:Clathrin light chain n=1 Tax=Chromera velia CCMP2878 TaxID=1169474 RepID=A0A0G4FEK8_9ALVE|mmetsp:Transcript_849/g.1834  ORF Transcript_849/g.1834 Transcript_849/m.1834 type:complete len:232 (+) Transcript_849:213-908(+)|eukprot:Cvel_16605.t1-p1 / transcript=Cvel_16605.t1 / gene=Cvel_16605 / organism=Chromera_velia_CCMP2878 / gene_product=hypothetical protein / transcript_product=hypothetical protein / location=Cvel_scaffold1286:22490-23182(+) / protein_length=231 / sequence_SO=supercontig / SO=protein_coding / is_pseudo=false
MDFDGPATGEFDAAPGGFDISDALGGSPGGAGEDSPSPDQQQAPAAADWGAMDDMMGFTEPAQHANGPSSYEPPAPMEGVAAEEVEKNGTTQYFKMDSANDQSPAGAEAAQRAAEKTIEDEERERQEALLLEKSHAEEKQRTKVREEANEYREKWYSQRREAIEKRKKSNRLEEEETSASRGEGTSSDPTAPCNWERTLSYIDFSKEKHNRDTSRMKTILFQLKSGGLRRP